MFIKNAVRMRVATEEEVKALQQQQQQQQRQRLKQQHQQQKQRRGLQIESVARTRQRNMQTQQAKSLHPKWQIPSNVIVKKIVLPPTPSQLRRAERR
eukprot:CAMPEP_0113418816 /NCGR_PEP_ID=MMETSP0013_2-20120614/26418_1 /TAXON_ID=2843 ORGANISM="Skeletonema costatum, Strain 1716" /NCGR_SAMPLE_ID=MMETSP0013_2 /ASSEMBLY_ACC=CAM_ASM_000158 /LENGTH=96 /DNA_ID=CAMNT_0000306097 /DNA_START=51 /DNA_END=341 /DNA_ORIENTATION=- /assembly_acc=CAM_ASM_000158